MTRVQILKAGIKGSFSLLLVGDAAGVEEGTCALICTVCLAGAGAVEPGSAKAIVVDILFH